MKKILPVAVLAALAGVNGTQAVNVNSDGLGQVLLYPFYTAEGGQDTYINLANTTDEFKAVKVRILESMNSQEVLDFNLYLSPHDHWSAVITADEDGEGATITTGDTSCTVPLAVSEGATIPFRDFEYQGDSEDGLDRTREGYVEVIEMATIIDTDWQEDIEHVNGVPGDCQDLDDSWNGGTWADNQNDGTSAPSGGLYGYGVLIDVDEGTAATYDAVALESFGTSGLHTEPGSLDPSLNNADPIFAVINGTSVITGTASTGIDAVSAIIMHDTVSNDYVLEPTIDAGTDWVMTFPTKRDYVAFDEDSDVIAPFTRHWDTEVSEACESFEIEYWDREEGSPVAPPGSNDFSPKPETPEADPFSLCAEANVLTFNDSNVLEASSRTGKSFGLEEGFNNGWARIDFDISERDGLDTSSATFYGLPVIGFAVQKYVNGELVVDGQTVLSNYAGTVTHKSTRDISN